MGYAAGLFVSTAIIESGLETANKEISALRRGDGWIKKSNRAGGIDGEY